MEGFDDSVPEPAVVQLEHEFQCKCTQECSSELCGMSGEEQIIFSTDREHRIYYIYKKRNRRDLA